MHTVHLPLLWKLVEEKIFISKIKYIFYAYWPCPRALTSGLGVLNFTILVEGFLNTIIMYLVLLPLQWKWRKRFSKIYYFPAMPIFYLYLNPHQFLFIKHGLSNLESNYQYWRKTFNLKKSKFSYSITLRLKA